MSRVFLSIFLLLILLSLLWGQNPPRELTAQGFSDPRVDLNWMTPVIPVEVEEIAYEDGSGGGADEAEAGDMISVRFTPTERCSLMSAKFYGYAMYPGINIQVIVYDDNGYGKPDIYSPLCSPITCEITTGWQEVDLSSAGLVFDPYEDFHIAIKKIADVDTFPHYIFVDTDDSTGRSWWYDYSMFGFHGIGGDLEIRALVYYTSGLMRWLPDGKRVKSADEVETGTHRMTYFSPEDVDYYIIYRNTVPDLSTMSYLATTSDTYYTDSDVGINATYYYAVKASYSDGGGISDYSSIASATTHSGMATTYLDTIILDDGTFDASATWTVNHGFGTVLNPPGVGLLRTLMIFFTNTGEFRPEIWSVDTTGAPDDLICSAPAFLSATSTGWRNVGWSSWTTTVVDKQFLVACICGYSPIGIGMDIPGYSSSFDFNGSSWSGMTDTTYMIRAITEYNTDCAYYHIHFGWNLVSLPVILADSSVSSIFPMAAGGLAYSYNSTTGSYDFASSIVPGKGYWILSYIDTSYTICGGTPLYTLDVEVQPGWNMVGGTAVPNGYSKYDIYDYPEGTLTSYPYLFEFDPDRASFVSTDRLYPGKGYFLLAFNSGIIRFEP